MDSRGTMYPSIEEAPTEAIEVPFDLVNMNRKCRRAYFAAVKKGLSESEALEIAKAVLPER